MSYANPALSPAVPGLVLTIDVGSSSLRTNLFSARAEQLLEFETQLAYEVRLTSDGGVEIDPALLVEAIFAAIDSTLGRAGVEVGDIVGVGMCSLVSNIMGIDEAGQPTTPIYTWADTRCAPDAADLRLKVDERDLRERTGSAAIHSSYLPARLMWLRRTMPRVYKRTALWISLGDWLYKQLFGRMEQSLSVASWNGLLNRNTLQWDGELLALLDVSPERLPSLVDLDTPMLGLQEPYATRWPALRDVPWFPCVGDGVASNLGSGCLSPDSIAVQVGTSGAMRAVVPGTPQTIPDGLWCYRVDSHASLLGGALSEGGNLFAWLRKTMGLDEGPMTNDEGKEHSSLVIGPSSSMQQAALLPPDSHGLTVLPFIAGERSPGWHGDARATISGISLHTRPAEIMRAAQEAVAYRFGIIFDLLYGVLPPTRRIIASGGALLNTPGWIGMLTDVLGQPVTASAESEASSKGTAMLVLRSLGLVDDFTQFPSAVAGTYKPDMARHAIYRRAMQRQQALYEALLRV